MTESIKKSRGDMTASELAKEMFTPRERVGIAMGRLGMMAYGDRSTNWEPKISDAPMDEDVMKEIDGICEILQNAKMSMAKRDMTVADLTAHVDAEVAKAAVELNAGKREVAAKRMQHLRREMAKAATTFDAGATHAPVALFSETTASPGDAVAALAKQVEALETKATEAAVVDPAVPSPAAVTPPPAEPTPVETTKANAEDDDGWPEDLASPAEIKKAKEWKPRPKGDDATA